MGRKKIAKNNILTGKNLIITSLTLLLAISGFLNLYFLNNKSTNSGSNTLTVESVIDGDTITVTKLGSVRLAGIDASEKGFCYNKESTEYLKSLIEGKDVKVEIERTGVYGRPVAFVYVGETFVNEELLKNGYARYEGRGSNRDKDLLEASNYAEENKLGLYTNCVSLTPPDPKCRIKGNINPGKSAAEGKVYHFEGCNNYAPTTVDLDRGEEWFCSEKEAKDAGYVKARNCYDKVYVP